MRFFLREDGYGFHLACGLGRVFLRIETAGRPRVAFDEGEITMDWTLLLSGAIASLLAIYLLIALLKPEWFA